MNWQPFMNKVYFIIDFVRKSEDNCIPCNVTKCNELCMRKRCKENYSQAELIIAMAFMD